MNAARTFVTILLGLAIGLASEPSFREFEAVQDSLRQMHPRFRAAWLRDGGIVRLDGGESPSVDSGPLRLVGRWSYGPAFDVDCRVTPTDTLVALARGSGVSLARFSPGASGCVELLADINCDFLATEVLIRDSLLFVNSAGVEVYGIPDLAHPVRLARLETELLGFDTRDTFLYTVGYDSFKVFSVADPASPRLVGACRDSGAAVSVAGSTAFVANASGLFAIDISNPAAPHRIGSWGGDILSVAARGNICCVTQDNSSQPSWLRFTILDATNPAAMVPLGSLDSTGGFDIRLAGTVAFLSGYYTGGHEFRMVDISDSTNPTRLGSCATLGNNFAVWGDAAIQAALVADDYGGLDIVDISNLGLPRVDTVAFRVGFAKDLGIDGNLCYVASEMAGLKVLDVRDPTVPTWIGDLDTACNNLTSWAVAARDSFAFTDWRYPYLRSVDVSDPANPRMAGSCQVTAHPEDMVLRDSLLYLAEDGVFEVVNVARRREPRVVGTCGLPNAATCVFLKDSLAFVGSWPSPIIDISDPAHPDAIGSLPIPVGGIHVRDTLAFVAEDYDSFYVYSVANPVMPALLGSLDLAGGHRYGQYNLSVQVVDTVAYVGGWQLKVLSVADPRHPREVVNRWNPPSYIPRITYAAPYLFVACSDGGVFIIETLQTGISEPARRSAGSRVSVAPSLTHGPVHVTVDAPGRAFDLDVFDVTGKLVQRESGSIKVAEAINLTGAPDGAYLVVVKTNGCVNTAKVVKTRR